MARIRRSLFLSLLTLSVAREGLTQSTTLTDQQITTVRARLADAAQRSWEIGTRAQVIIEYDSPSFNVISTNCSFPLPTKPNKLDTPLDIARSVVSQKPQNSEALFDDGSVADPAAAGPVVLIANWTGQRDQDYAGAAEQQLDYLLNKAPRFSNGAISHRSDKTQLWSDFIYMVPPYLAMYGAIQRNTTIMDEAYNQIKLYRDELRDDSGMWKHITGEGDGLDSGHWSTGNGWAALGMLRVAGTYRAYSSDYNDKQNELYSWVSEILDAMYKQTSSANTALFHNYADEDSTFLDASSTSAIAAATYHLAVLTDGRGLNSDRLNDAERARQELSRFAGDARGHIDGDGWISPVPDPHDFPHEGSHSAEAQAFVVSMYAGYREWQSAGRPGASAGIRKADFSTAPAVLLPALAFLLA